MSPVQTPALTITNVTLRILIVLNWAMFAATLFLLIAPFTRDWITSALDLAPSPAAERVVFGLRTIGVIGLITVPLYHLIFVRLLAMVGTARAGDPFVNANGRRLQQIGWALVGLQACGLLIGGIVRAISTKSHPVNIHAGMSIAGCLAILLCFVLARVFAEGARMRDELAGTV